jgi:DNA end-binding protein Ku
MARQLIDSLTADFDPSRYHDTYREAVLDMIERKADGQEIVVQPAEEPEKVPDLMAALEASLANAKKSGGDEKPAASRSRKKSTSANGAGGKKKPSPSRSKPKAKAKS